MVVDTKVERAKFSDVRLENKATPKKKCRFPE